MTRIILEIYEYMRGHIVKCAISFCVVTAVLLCLIFRIDFNEDIAAFLPMGERYQKAMQVYQDVSGASNIVAVFQHTPCDDSLDTGPGTLVTAVDDFIEELTDTGTVFPADNVLYRIDMETISEITDFVYNNIPFFLSDTDYARIDSLMRRDGYVIEALENSKQMLMSSSFGFVAGNIARDPLGLFAPVISRLAENAGGELVETYDGYLFTDDMQKCIVLITSPYGNSETKRNSELVHMLEDIASEIEDRNGEVRIHFTGGPCIAVGNSEQIKRDSIISVLLAVTLILLLMTFVFRTMRNILLLAFSIAWGWMFALGALSLFNSSISLIVVGISSIILGIAINYPLHLVTHFAHTPNMRQTLAEIVPPLVIGNVTTVGAFMALIPLDSVALRDLGIFSAFLLLGTIIFVVIYLPHIVKGKQTEIGKENGIVERWLQNMGNLQLENNKWCVGAVLLLTCLFLWYSSRTGFDSDISHINYMTDEQREDMEQFQKILSGTESGKQCVYVVSEGNSIEEALIGSNVIQNSIQKIVQKFECSKLSSCSEFLIPIELQSARIDKWNLFLEKYNHILKNELSSAAIEAGFKAGAFSAFDDIINRRYEPKDFSHFRPLKPIYASNISMDAQTGKYYIIDAISVGQSDIEAIRTEVSSLEDSNHFCFDIQSMNMALSENLSSNFNYIGWACGLIVFIFLWFSFGNLELAIISFIPMTVSWIWILGIMGILGIQFNIVNVILATFIFGQGDDYTIFITEGCCHEYAYRKKILASYKSSIIISALIMFIGIGSLIFAGHPALHTLAEVTIIGMTSVVLMAYLLPPLVFRWLVLRRNEYRIRPLSVLTLLRTLYLQLLRCLYFLCRYSGNISFVRRIFSMMLKTLPGVKFRIHYKAQHRQGCPALLIYDKRSPIDPIYLETLGFGIQMPINEYGSNEIISRARKMNADILPVTIIGTDYVMPMGTSVCHNGFINIYIGDKIRQDSLDGIIEVLKNDYDQILQKNRSVTSIIPLVLDRYRYKGVTIMRTVRTNLKKCSDLLNKLELEEKDDSVYMKNAGYGELSLLYALLNPDKRIYVYEKNNAVRELAKYAADGIAHNLEYLNPCKNE